MKRLSIDKLIMILQDYKENGTDAVYDDDMEQLYEIYGDEAFYDMGTQDAEITSTGREYIKIKERVRK